MDVPNLIAIQTDSFEFFKGEGLAQAFHDISPIENSTKDMCVEFGKHEFGEPKYTVDECKEKDVSCLLYTSTHRLALRGLALRLASHQPVPQAGSGPATHGEAPSRLAR